MEIKILESIAGGKPRNYRKLYNFMVRIKVKKGVKKISFSKKNSRF